MEKNWKNKTKKFAIINADVEENSEKFTLRKHRIPN